MDRVKFFEGCLSQTLLGLVLNTLTSLFLQQVISMQGHQSGGRNYQTNAEGL